MKAAIMDNDGNVVRIVDTTEERAKEKGWVPVGELPAKEDERLNEIYEQHQGHKNAARAHAKVNEMLKTLGRPEDYCTKTAFLGYLNQTELLK